MLYIVLNLLIAAAVIAIVTWVIVKAATAAANHPRATAKALVAMVCMLVLFGCYMTSNAEEVSPIPELFEIKEFTSVEITNFDGKECLALTFIWKGQELELLWEGKLNLKESVWVEINPETFETKYIEEQPSGCLLFLF